MWYSVVLDTCCFNLLYPIATPSWWRHQMETFSALLAICAENSPVPDEFPTQRPVTLSFDVFFDLRLNKRLSKQSWGWWFETQLHPLWRHRNVFHHESLPSFVQVSPFACSAITWTNDDLLSNGPLGTNYVSCKISNSSFNKMHLKCHPQNVILIKSQCDNPFPL